LVQEGEGMSEEVLQLLKEKFPEAVVEIPEGTKDPTAVIRRENIREVALFLRDEIGFNYLSFMAGVDYPERFEVGLLPLLHGKGTAEQQPRPAGSESLR
jgi:NADH:ubiquinone oxidoreductase subunit C